MSIKVGIYFLISLFIYLFIYQSSISSVAATSTLLKLTLKKEFNTEIKQLSTVEAVSLTNCM